MFPSAVAGRPAIHQPLKRRRTATTVLAGDYDPRPPRDVLTSLLNGVGPYKSVEGDEEERKLKRRERKRREKEKRRLGKQQARAERSETAQRQQSVGQPVAGPSGGQPTHSNGEPLVNSSTSSFWRIRGPAIVATRSVSPTPPPELSSPPTPGPSISSSMSYGSSKRPHTPEDGFSIFDRPFTSSSPAPHMQRPRKKRSAARKGWKGWVEGSPPPSDKLINLDSAPVMVERRTRSGKNFDAISEGTDTWVDPDH
ncbi:hypothetical protein M0805_008554 [Coniferiporia weirii]|nr:hypothetical protein M0805_008554 [Coniferiporia weirii]